MNLDELRTVQTKERQKDSLQHLRDAFYEDVADYITDLKDERERAAAEADDPFSDPDVSRLTDEIETAEEVVEAVYERRVGKVVKLSSFAAAEMPVDEGGLTVQERDLFEDLVGRIGENKTRVLEILAGEGDAGKAGGTATAAGSPDATDRADSSAPSPSEAVDESATERSTDPTADESPSRAEPAFGGDTDGDAADSTPDGSSSSPTGTGSKPQAPPDAPPSNDADEVVEREDPAPGGGDAAENRTTVRVTADVGRVLGVDDREYDLRSEDVVALPADNAEALLRRDAAERLE